MADILIHQDLHQSIIVTAKVSHNTVWYVCVDYELLKPLQGGPVIIVCIVIDCEVHVILFNVHHNNEAIVTVHKCNKKH